MFKPEDFEGCQFGQDYHGKAYADRANALHDERCIVPELSARIAKMEAETARLRAEISLLRGPETDWLAVQANNARLREALEWIAEYCTVTGPTRAVEKARTALAGGKEVE
jgi:uncharacterized small protein (DUF1192 family)